MKRIRGLAGFLLAVFLCLGGCSSTEGSREGRTEAEYTVVETEKLPPQLLELIEKNKKNEIRMTFEDGEDLYLVRGYGEQKTGGYSISVAECTQDEEAVYLDTRLIGPSNQDQLPRDPSYPCLVLKMKNQEKDVEIQ